MLTYRVNKLSYPILNTLDGKKISLTISYSEATSVNISLGL